MFLIGIAQASLSSIEVSLQQCHGGSNGLVVMAGYSCPRGCEFESQHRIVRRSFLTRICCKNLCLTRPEIYRKDGQYLKNGCDAVENNEKSSAY